MAHLPPSAFRSRVAVHRTITKSRLYLLGLFLRFESADALTLTSGIPLSAPTRLVDGVNNINLRGPVASSGTVAGTRTSCANSQVTTDKWRQLAFTNGLTVPPWATHLILEFDITDGEAGRSLWIDDVTFNAW